MDVVTQPSTTVVSATVVDVQTSGVSWAAIIAGAVSAVALSLILFAFGAGLGLSAVSPWADSGVSGTTFKVGTGIYLCVVAVMSSAIGGYLAARLRTKWQGVNANEVFFRDTAHGLLAWALATVLMASLLASATTRVVGAAATATGGAAAPATQAASPAALSVDKLLRAGPAQPAAATPAGGAENADAVRAEMLRLWTASMASGDIAAEDRQYLARIVARQTGLSEAEAERRVTAVVTEAKAAADRARKAAAQAAFWLAASLLLGAFAASLAAVEGGQLRDGTWNGRVLTPRPI